jgi:RIO kinase 1
LRKPKRRFDDYFFEEQYRDDDEVDKPEVGDRWSTWDLSSPLERGPLPHPDWLVTELAAVDTEHGVLKTGKEADACLLTRGIPGGRSCLLVAKRYRTDEHRLFHRDSGYLEGRRVRESRVNRAMANRSGFGKEAIAAQWAVAEFGALSRLWQICQDLEVEPFVPYPVQIMGTEVLMEYIGSPDGTAAPRLAAVKGDETELRDLWQQLLLALTVMARAGFAHGDLSPYNVLVHEGRVVVIDLPQIVDVIANPAGKRFLERDVHNVVSWFTARGLSDLDESAIVAELFEEAGAR